MSACLTPGCNEPLVARGATWTTLVGYGGPEDGHDHDDNCHKRAYRCAAGHVHTLSVRRTCPKEGCRWQGKTSCFCHDGEKITTWPQGEIAFDRGSM